MSRGTLGHAYDVLFRMLPHRAPTGLTAVGNPGRDSPVLVTGNYTETVRRLKEALRGEDVWLLVANSKGINVWCAAGGGHLTHHDVISAVVTSGAGSRVDHRDLILPQLSATGIERKKIEDATGWSASWGPARVEDIPGFLRRNRRATPKERFMRFPLRDRLEMAVMWSFPMTVIGIPLFAWLGGPGLGLLVGGVMLATVFGIFAALPRLRVTGRIRWVTFALFASGGFALGALAIWLLGEFSPPRLALIGGGAIIAMSVLSVDLAGTTPLYGSYINTFRNRAHIDLVLDRCTGTSECVQVCPRDVIEMTPMRRQVRLARPDDCVQCGACVVQCPTDALRFRYDDGSIVEPATIRSTRMNMLGRRTIPLRESQT